MGRKRNLASDDARHTYVQTKRVRVECAHLRHPYPPIQPVPLDCEQLSKHGTYRSAIRRKAIPNATHPPRYSQPRPLCLTHPSKRLGWYRNAFSTWPMRSTFPLEVVERERLLRLVGQPSARNPLGASAASTGMRGGARDTQRMVTSACGASRHRQLMVLTRPSACGRKSSSAPPQ